MNAGLVKGEGFAVDASVIEANASRYHGKAPDEIDWLAPERQTHAVVEFLAAFDDEDSDADRKVPKVVSHYLIDLGPHAVIVDVEGTPARTYDEVAATKTMINRTEETFGLKLKRLAADTAYGTGKLLAWLLEKDITPHIPVWERYERTDGMFSRLDFTYDAERDVYICPNGRFLRTTGKVHDSPVRNYLSQSAAFRVCELKGRCTSAPFS